MAEVLIVLGAFCVVTAIVGGGLEVTSVGKMPVIDSPLRQLILALCGAALIAGGFARSNDNLEPPVPDSSAEAPSMTVSPKIARPGTRLTIDARGFQPGERVIVKGAGEELGSSKANTQGRIADKLVRFPRDYGFAGR